MIDFTFSKHKHINFIYLNRHYKSRSQILKKWKSTNMKLIRHPRMIIIHKWSEKFDFEYRDQF